MTYRQKAAKLLIEHLGCSPYHALDIVNLIDKEGEYIPAVFNGLGAPQDIEDWDAEIPESETENG
jgi:hypothetical protein